MGGNPRDPQNLRRVSGTFLKGGQGHAVLSPVTTSIPRRHTLTQNHHVHLIAGYGMACDSPTAPQHFVIWMRDDDQDPIWYPSALTIYESAGANPLRHSDTLPLWIVSCPSRMIPSEAGPWLNNRSITDM